MKNVAKALVAEYVAAPGKKCKCAELELTINADFLSLINVRKIFVNKATWYVLTSIMCYNGFNSDTSMSSACKMPAFTTRNLMFKSSHCFIML